MTRLAADAPPSRARRRAMRLVLVALLAAQLSACEALDALPIGPSPPPLPEGFGDLLWRNGQAFTPTAVPPDVVSADEILQAARETVRHVPGRPIYGVVTCTNPNGRCEDWWSEDPDETFGVWVVGFPGVAGANGPPDQAWAVFDPATGAFITGDWP